MTTKTASQIQSKTDFQHHRQWRSDPYLSHVDYSDDRCSGHLIPRQPRYFYHRLVDCASAYGVH